MSFLHKICEESQSSWLLYFIRIRIRIRIHIRIHTDKSMDRSTWCIHIHIRITVHFPFFVGHISISHIMNMES